MSGNQLLTASSEERLKQHEDMLEEYKLTNGVVAVAHNTEVTEILTYNRKQLNALSAEDCGEGAFILSQYACYLQQEYNTQHVRYKWATNELNQLIAKVKSNYDFDRFSKWELVKSSVIAGETAGKKLNEIIINAESRMTIIDDLVHKINTMSQHLKELQQTKRYRK